MYLSTAVMSCGNYNTALKNEAQSLSHLLHVNRFRLVRGIGLLFPLQKVSEHKILRRSYVRARMGGNGVMRQQVKYVTGSTSVK